MLGSSARLLRLLTLLQARPEWLGTELAGRLDVSLRTLRRDIERLRDLGYPIHGTKGPAGGYSLPGGSALPPLLLDDEEAVAIALALRIVAGASVSGIEETSIRALTKLEQALPARLRREVAALHSATDMLGRRGPTIDPRTLATLAAACRDRVRLRFDYHGNDETRSERLVEPQSLVSPGRRWYLVAFDIDRADWRSFRIDRLEALRSTGTRFVPRALPAGGASALVAEGLASRVVRFKALVTLHAPISVIANRMYPPLGVLEAVDDKTCLLTSTADSLDGLVGRLIMFGVDFDVHQPPELIEHLRVLSDRIARAAPDRVLASEIGPGPRTATAARQ
jgi:predicted DNA-binding transcriptional regulator YafY